MPLVIGAPSSDDEDDGPAAGGAGPGGLRMPAPPALNALDISDDGLQLPAGLAGMQLAVAEAKAEAAAGASSSAADAMSQTAFLLSQSGAFKTADFQIRKEGGLKPIGEDQSSSAEEVHSRPYELSQAHQAVPALEVQAISELEMLGELGSGASGTVHRARHTATGTIVAVKAVTILEKAKRDQVVKELRIMRKHTLGARWLVGMYQAFYEDAKVFTVLEFMDAGSVEDLVKQHAASGGLADEARLVQIARDLLEGLNYLHRQLHQVHRDLKPANVMLNSKGEVKISDFGISSQLDRTEAFCETFVGTTCYMSPERLSGDNYSYSADIWAYGIILLELATGKYPYKAPNSFFELLQTIGDSPPPTLPPGKFSPLLGEFIALCLDKSPNSRLSAKDLLKHPWLKSAPPPAQPSLGREDSRHDRPGSSLERSRSNLSDSISSVNLADTLAGMKLDPGA